MTKELEEKVTGSIRKRYLTGEQIDRPIHPASSYAQAVRNLLESGEIDLDEVQRVFPDTDFLNPPE